MNQKIFSVWYGLVIESRLKIAKANSVSHWKISSKVFNAWKKYSITENYKKQQEKYNIELKIEHQKMKNSIIFHNLNIFKKYFSYWKQYTMHSFSKRELEQEKAMNRNRMERFLEAASGKNKIGNELDVSGTQNLDLEKINPIKGKYS